MLKTELDKRSIVDGYRPQIKMPVTGFVLSVVLTAFVLTGCATAPEEPISPERPALTEQQQQEIALLLEQAIQADQIGDFSQALSLYKEILIIRGSALVAERATRIAAQMNRWDEAQRTSLVWMRLQPQSEDARQMAIVAALRSGRTDAAIDLLVDDIENAEDDITAWQTAIGLLVVAGASEPETEDSGPAVLPSALLERLLNATGHEFDSAFGWLQRSRLAWQQGRADQALDYALNANQQQADYINSMWAASLSSRQQAYAQAQRLYSQARELVDPDSERAVQAALAESEVLNQMERPQESLALLRTLPDAVDTLYARTLILMELDQRENAVRQWQRMAEIAEISAEADLNRNTWLVAVMAEVLELNERAIDWYGRVSDERRPNAQMRRAGLLADNGQLQAARDALAQLRDGSDPSVAEQSYLVESELLIGQQQADAALELLIQAVSEQPASTALLYGRAMAAVQVDQIDLAEQDLRAIIQRDNQNALALNALGYTLSDRTDRQQEAYRLIERALALEPENPAILDSMGWVLFKLGQPEQALDYLQRAAEGDFHPEILSHLIEVLWALGREHEARQWLARAEPDFFDDPVFSDMLSRTGLGE